jgi:hypothetical protein
MSKFILNLLVQISKVCQKSKFQIKFEKVLFLELGPTLVFCQAAAHFLFLSQPAHSPSPHWASASRSAQPALSAQLAASLWHPTRLPPPSWGSASPRTTFTPLRAQLTGGPCLSSPSSSSAGLGFRHRFPPPPTVPAATQHLEMPPPRLYSPAINAPLNPSLSHPTFNGVKAITASHFFGLITGRSAAPPPRCHTPF